MLIRWTSDAANDLENIVNYLNREHPSASPSVVVAVIESIASLTRFPSRGRPGRIAGTRELVVPNLPYIVVYFATDQVIQLLRIFHAAQDWS